MTDTDKHTEKFKAAYRDIRYYEWRWAIFSAPVVTFFLGALLIFIFFPRTVELTKEVPVEKIVEKIVTKEVPVIKEVVKEVVKLVPAPPSPFPCSVREKEIDLSTNLGQWVTLTEGGPNECVIVYLTHPKAIVIARDGMGEFMLTAGVLARNPRAVQLVAGNGYFKYSTCPRVFSRENKPLNWDCSLK